MSEYRQLSAKPKPKRKLIRVGRYREGMERSWFDVCVQKRPIGWSIVIVFASAGPTVPLEWRLFRGWIRRVAEARLQKEADKGHDAQVLVLSNGDAR